MKHKKIHKLTGSEELERHLKQWAIRKGDKPCILETNTDAHSTYQEFYQATLALRKKLGKKPKTVLLALSGGIIDSVVWLSALTGGHLLVPVSPHLTSYEYEQLIKKHMPDVIFSETGEFFHTSRAKIITRSDCESLVANKQKTIISSAVKEGTVYLSTSGSTGIPKGIILTATNIVITADNIRNGHHITENDRGLTPLPFYHVNAPVVSLITSILAGSCTIIAPKFSTSRFWNWVKTYDPTWISAVPTIIAMLLSTEPQDFLKKSSLRFIRTASAPLPAANLKRFEEKFQIPIIETYGISEAASTISANPVPPALHKAGSVGFPLGVHMKICQSSLSGNLKEVPQGTTGEIYIKGQNVITSYEGGAGKESFYRGWFRTGDLGYFDQDGYLFITGRKKEIIIRGGENIAPREIEEVLLTYPHVQEAAVVGHPDPIYGERVVGFITADIPVDQMFIDNLKQYASQKLSPEKVPSELYLLEALPRGNTGKIDKKKLKQMEIFI